MVHMILAARTLDEAKRLALSYKSDVQDRAQTAIHEYRESLKRKEAA